MYGQTPYICRHEGAGDDGRCEPQSWAHRNSIDSTGQSKSVSSFILRIVKNHAQKLIAENDRILVSERDQAVFFEAVLGEVKPNAALKQAFDRHQSAMQDQ